MKMLIKKDDYLSNTEYLAAYCQALSFADLDSDVVAVTKSFIIDNFGCAIGGAQTKVGKVVIEVCRKLSGSAEYSHGAKLIGIPSYVGYAEAAFGNAFLINIMDYDDTGSTGHPGSTILGAAFAAVEYLKKEENKVVSGEEFIEAVVAAYQAAMRVSEYLFPSWERYKMIHGIGSAQIFGSTVVCGKLLGLTADEMADAMGIGGAFASVAHAGKFGWEEERLSWVKDNVARPAEGGLRAALLAKNGFVGNRTILDGVKGFYLMAGSDAYYDEKILSEPDDYKIMNLSYNPYPCCRWMHTTMDAVKFLADTISFVPAQIEQIKVVTIESLAKSFINKCPQTMIDAEFSIPYCIAAMLYKVPYTQWHEDANLHSRELLALADKVIVEEASEYQSVYLQNGRLAWHIPSRVEIIAKDGTQIVREEMFAGGSPKKEFTYQERKDKFLSLGGTLEIFVQLEKLETVADVAVVLEKL